jgi:branched-chain amino acid transport system substrate-binding protein
MFLVACGEDETTTTEASTDTTAASTDTTMASKGTIKIGHIRPISGVMAMTSQRMLDAFDFAFEQVNYQVAGYDIEIIVGDSKADPATAVEVARKMVESDGVAMIVGPTQGGEQMAVAGYANDVGIPILFTNPAPMPTTTPGFPFCVLGGGSEPQISSAMGVWCYDEAGYMDVDILTSDFAPGHGFLGAFKAAFESKGGTVVQEIYAPYPTADFSPYLTTLEDADAVISWTDGEQAIKLLSQYFELSVDERMPIAAAFHGSFFAPFILRALPPDASEALVGGVTPTPYTPLIIIRALTATDGDTTPEALRDALVAVTFDGPAGEIKFDPATRALIADIYICEIAKQDGAFVWNPVFTYEDVPAVGLENAGLAGGPPGGGPPGDGPPGP